MRTQMTFKCTVTHFRPIPLSFLAVWQPVAYRTSTSLDGQQSSPSQFNKNRIRMARLQTCTSAPLYISGAIYRLSVSVNLALFWTVISLL